MIEVEIQNFQSIEKLSLKIEGFSAIVGRSNIGKSAVVRAIQCALTGATGTDFVRHRPKCERLMRGNKKCRCQASVMIKTDKLKLLWEKGDAINQYTVWQAGETGKGTIYSKIDRGTPEFLLPDFEPVKVGKDTSLVQVSEQFSPIFLLDQGGNTVADVLSDVAQLDQVNVAMGLVSKDRKSAQSTRSVREKDILALGEALVRFEGLDEAAADVDAVETQFRAVEGAQKAAEQLDRYVETSEILTVAVGALEAATTPSLPEADPLREAAQKRAELERFFMAVKERAPIVRKLSGIDKVELPDEEPLQRAAGQLDLIVGWVTRLQEFKAEIPRLKKLDKMAEPDPDPVRAALVKLEQLQGLVDKQARLDEWATKLELEERLEAESDPEPMREGLVQVKQIEGYIHKQAGLEERVAELTGELADAEKEEATILEEINELGVCPTCSQNIDADHCLHLEGS